MAWVSFVAIDVFLKSLYQNIFIANVSKPGWLHIKGIYIINLLIHQSQYVNLAFLLKVSHMQYWWICNFICPLWYLLSFSEHPNYLFSLVDIFDAMMRLCWKFIYILLRWILALCYAFKQRSYWYIYDFWHLLLNIVLLQVVLLLSYLCSLALICVQNYIGASEDSMLCTQYWNANPTLCTYLGEISLDF